MSVISIKTIYLKKLLNNCWIKAKKITKFGYKPSIRIYVLIEGCSRALGHVEAVRFLLFARSGVPSVE